MATEILNLEVKSNVKGAVKDMDALGKSVEMATYSEKELNDAIDMQRFFLAEQRTELTRLKEIQDSIPKGGWHAGQSELNESILKVTETIQDETKGLKKLQDQQKKNAKATRDLTTAQKRSTNAAIRGIQHFQIMGVSIRRVKNMVRGVIPMFKLLFTTIKSGIVSTGIGAIVLAIIAIGTSMKNSVAGGKAFKAMMEGIGDVVRTVTKAITFVGDAILSIFGYDSEPPVVKSISKVTKAMQELKKVQDEVDLRESGQQKQKFLNQQIVDDTTKSEKERNDAAAAQYAIDAKNITDRINAQQVVLDAINEETLAWIKLTKRKEATKGVDNMLAKSYKKTTKEKIALREKEQKIFNELELEQLQIADEFGKTKVAIKSKNLNLTTEFEEAAAAAEIEIAKQVEQIKNELAYRELKTAEAVEKAKLKTANAADKKEIENSKASKTTKDAALLKLEEKYQSDLGIITDKFEKQRKLKKEKSEEILAALKATNIEDEKTQALTELQIQKDKEDESLKSFDNYLALKIELDKKYDTKKEEIEEAARLKTEAKEKKLADFKEGLMDQGLAIIGKALDVQAATIEKNYKEEIELAEKNGKSTEGIEKKYDDKRKENAAKQKALKIGLAIIDTYQSATAAYANALAIPGAGLAMAPIAAALAIAAGLANIAMIRQTDVGGGGGGGGSLPASSTETPAPEMMSGAFELTGGQPVEPLQAYVVSDDITNNQNKLAIIRRRATI